MRPVNPPKPQAAQAAQEKHKHEEKLVEKKQKKSSGLWQRRRRRMLCLINLILSNYFLTLTDTIAEDIYKEVFLNGQNDCRVAET